MSYDLMPPIGPRNPAWRMLVELRNMYLQNPDAVPEAVVERYKPLADEMGISWPVKTDWRKTAANVAFNIADTALLGLLPNSLKESIGGGTPLTPTERALDTASEWGAALIPWGIFSKAKIGSKIAGRLATRLAHGAGSTYEVAKAATEVGKAASAAADAGRAAAGANRMTAAMGGLSKALTTAGNVKNDLQLLLAKTLMERPYLLDEAIAGMATLKPAEDPLGAAVVGGTLGPLGMAFLRKLGGMRAGMAATDDYFNHLPDFLKKRGVTWPTRYPTIDPVPLPATHPAAGAI